MLKEIQLQFAGVIINSFSQRNEIGFNYDIDDIVNYFKLYNNLMKFWEKNIKNKNCQLDYELLVQKTRI